MRPSSNREFENHFRVFPSAVRVDAIRIVFRDSAESFIPCTVLRTARAGRSAEDRLLCKQEALGSNPSRSTPVPYLPRFKSTFRTVPDLGLGWSAWPCAGHGTGSYQARSGSVGT